MNELKISGKVEFMGKEIPVIEGGFGENCRVLSDNTIAIIHSMETKNIRGRIKNNISRFKENIDFIDLKGAYDTSTLESLGYSKQSISQAENLYLLSERGYGKLIKIMDNDLAWDIYDDLLDNYFSMRKEIATFKLPQTYKEALIELVAQVEKNEILELNNKKQQEVIEEQKPKAEYFDALVDSKLLTNFRDSAKELGIKQNEFMKFLEEKKFIYRDKKGKPKPYANHVDNGLFELKDFESNGYADVRVLVTVKGKETFRLLLRL